MEEVAEGMLKKDEMECDLLILFLVRGDAIVFERGRLFLSSAGRSL